MSENHFSFLIFLMISIHYKGAKRNVVLFSYCLQPASFEFLHLYLRSPACDREVVSIVYRVADPGGVVPDPTSKKYRIQIRLSSKKVFDPRKTTRVRPYKINLQLLS